LYICKFSGCSTSLNPDSNLDADSLAFQYRLCSFCYNKVMRFERMLDDWLEQEFPFLTLDDLVGWYTLCINNPCKRDCLDIAYPSIIGCTCCPHLQHLGYHRYRIDNHLLPSKQWIEENILDEIIL